jgi:hypothetical protein
MDINQSMPWIVAFFIGSLSLIVNILVNKSQRKISIKNIENQTEISRQVINKDILSKNRQEWINTLRDSVSQYLSSHELSKLIRQYDQKSKSTQPEYREEFKSWQSLYYKIKLLLNSNEENPKQLIELMTQLNLATDYSSMSKEAEYERIKNEIIKVTQIILKEEWERVKKLQ